MQETTTEEPYGGYAVFRPAPGLPEGFVPEKWDGRWERVIDIDPADVKSVKFGDHGRARPTGRFETNGEGAQAEVWEIRDERP